MQNEECNIDSFIQLLEQILGKPSQVLQDSMLSMKQMTETAQHEYEKLIDQTGFDFSDQSAVCKQILAQLPKIERSFKKIDYLARYAEIVQDILQDIESVVFDKPISIISQLFKRSNSQKEIEQLKQGIKKKIVEADQFLDTQSLKSASTADRSAQQEKQIADNDIVQQIIESPTTKSKRQGEKVQYDQGIKQGVEQLNKQDIQQEIIDKHKLDAKAAQNDQLQEKQPSNSVTTQKKSKVKQFLESDDETLDNKIEHSTKPVQQDHIQPKSHQSEGKASKSPLESKQSNKNVKSQKNKSKQIKGIIVQAEDESD